MNHGNGVSAPGHVDEPISTRVVTAVADAEGVAPDRLATPLYDAVDLDALDSLHRHPGDTVTVAFTHLGYRVSVAGDGTVSVAAE